MTIKAIEAEFIRESSEKIVKKLKNKATSGGVSLRWSSSDESESYLWAIANYIFTPFLEAYVSRIKSS